MLRMSQEMRLQQKLTPQQVQYLKLLQLPVLALEQRLKTELEINPVLEEEPLQEQSSEEPGAEAADDSEQTDPEGSEYSIDDYMNDELAGHKSPDRLQRGADEENEREETGGAYEISLRERLLQQFRLSSHDDTENLLAEEIIGNLGDDGYLRRDLDAILQDINLSYGLTIGREKIEKAHAVILQLDPPGVGARTLQECLIAQARAGRFDPALKDLALRILTHHFTLFEEKRYDALCDALAITRDHLRTMMEQVILKLNPKPGEVVSSAESENHVIPDFTVTKDEKSDSFIIELNDRDIPNLRINRTYQKLYSAKSKNVGTETKDFIRKQFENAKFFISAIQQRRYTLLKVMETIVENQRRWFETGEGLKPMIYKEISEVVKYDISTISRVVNSKYVLTEYGMFPLRFFFTSGMTADNGEEVSARTLKETLKSIIGGEDPRAPLSDEEIAKLFKEKGVTLARRTVAKYREQLGIPVARFRKKL